MLKIKISEIKIGLYSDAEIKISLNVTFYIIRIFGNIFFKCLRKKIMSNQFSKKIKGQIEIRNRK